MNSLFYGVKSIQYSKGNVLIRCAFSLKLKLEEIKFSFDVNRFIKRRLDSSVSSMFGF